jgi:hypothetical protein
MMKEEFCFREHRTGTATILAVCDAELVNSTLKFRDVDFEVSESFYGSEGAGRGQVLEMLERCHIANIVGKKAVELLVNEGRVDRECVLMIGDVPHVQILRM